MLAIKGSQNMYFHTPPLTEKSSKNYHFRTFWCCMILINAKMLIMTKMTLQIHRFPHEMPKCCNFNCAKKVADVPEIAKVFGFDLIICFDNTFGSICSSWHQFLSLHLHLRCPSSLIYDITIPGIYKMWIRSPAG